MNLSRLLLGIAALAFLGPKIVTVYAQAADQTADSLGSRLSYQESLLEPLPETDELLPVAIDHGYFADTFRLPSCDKPACDCRRQGCPNCGCCFKWSDEAWVKLGLGLRTSYNAFDGGAPNGSWDNNFNLDNMRLYLNGQGHRYLKAELNFDINNAQGFEDFDEQFGGGAAAANSFEEAGEVRILDAIVKFEFNDLFNIWAGRFKPPSDRSNLAGPFYLNIWSFPFVQSGYQNIFQGRDDGIAYWGQIGGGAFKWQFSLFEGNENTTPGVPAAAGVNPGDKMLFAGRVMLNLLDPEPGYYNQSTYYGDKDILAVGASMFYQEDGFFSSTDGLSHYSAWNIDVLFERQIFTGGVVSLEGAYYDVDDNAVTDDTLASLRQGQGYFLLASYLYASELCIGPLSGRLQPFVRVQQYHRDFFLRAATGGANTRFRDGLDIGVNYIMYGHNARISILYGQRGIQGGGEAGLVQLGTQFQF